MNLCNRCVLIGLLIWGLFACQKTDERAETQPVSGPPLFTLLTPEQTGIAFQNRLDEGLNTNILLYEYFYNGGGVATGDFNGDGRIDAYFTANMADNRLYLNQGNRDGEPWQFRDVTDASGAGGRPGPWKTGVTVVDINADEKLDLYVCYSGAMPPEKRVNQLFVNQGNDANGVPRFAEQAAQYGLDSPGFSNQAYFLDYDRDGDLDMLLLNHNPKNLPILNEASTAELLRTDDPERGLRLYKQTAGRFTDVTQQAGINGSPLSYGLGLGMADINDDGWLDFYVSNDYTVPDYLYINNRNGTFANELPNSIGHTSQFSMGNDVADVNNDGRADIFTLDMLPEDNRRQKLLMAPDNFAKFDLNVRSGLYYQYMRNMLHLNTGVGVEGARGRVPVFSEVGQQAGVSNTDWSWAALLADFDNDGWKDLFVSNGYLHDYTNLDFIKYMDDFAKSRGRLQRQDVLEIINHMPASNVVNYVFRNEGGASFANQTQNWGMNRPSNSNGAAYADFDNDGDLDLMVNNINQPAFVYRNEANAQTKHPFLQVKLRGKGGNTQGIGARVTVYANGTQQTQTQTLARGYLSAVSPVLHFGLGKAKQLDSVRIIWPLGTQQTFRSVAANQVLEADETKANEQPKTVSTPKPLLMEVAAPLAYANPVQDINDFYRQSLLTNQLSHSGPCMAKGDLTGDGLEDLFVGASAQQPAMVYVQQKGGRFVPQKSPALDADRGYHDCAVALFDANGDGSLDVYVATGGYHDMAPNDPRLQDRLYLNDGRGNLSHSPNALPDLRVSNSCVAVQDVNGDGRPDLFVGGRLVPGRYPETPNSYLLINNSKGRGGPPQFTDQTATFAPGLRQVGMVTDAVWADLNGDRRNELVVVGEWMPLTVFALEGGKLNDKTSTYFEKPYRGWWNKIAATDLNNDRKADLLVGNWGDNSQMKAADKQPVEMHYADFDGNGSVESVLSAYIQGKSYPYVTRDELLNQINGYRTRYPNYESYADQTLDQIFDRNALAKAEHLTANHLQTSCFLSSASGRFTVAKLPEQAQYAPVHTITTMDFDRDGLTDVLLCGNTNFAKIRLGKMDANYGVLLKGNGRGGFQYVDQRRSGLALKGDVRAVVPVNNTLLFGINEKKLVAYQWK
ncbi:VCBS repeat-containing protein [Spirosoma montaniterrae]|uniref:RNA-binding protein n=1 Tax=Spirosoma montaniterrae TaxID=1178516 RepID=A0A1P9X4C5_9BACT|nr:VCBS repeat-containing protein [Spirosoma montaniterrae]AQG82457.1 RNA-binding protein [Spirosoma montaniterrae]